MMASRFASALLRVALVATMASVVLSRGLPLLTGCSRPAGNGDGKPHPPNSPSCSNGAAQKQGPEPTTALPAALTAASAPTMNSPHAVDAEPRPPFRLTVVAPSPAPALPRVKRAFARTAAS